MGRVFTDAAEQEKSESAKGTRLELRQSHPIGIMYKLGIFVGLTVKGKKIRAFNLIDEYTRQMSLHLRR